MNQAPKMGHGRMWLASQGEVDFPPFAGDFRAALKLTAEVRAVESGVAAPSVPPWHGVYGVHVGGNPLTARVISLRGDDGVEWKLGYEVHDGAGVDVTPAPPVAVGARVTLDFRVIRAFGEAPAFVLSNDKGLLLAFNLAIYGDALPDPAAGLTITDGRLVAETKGGCYDERYFNLVFSGDTAIEVPSDEQASFSLGGTPFAARHLFNYKPTGPGGRCFDAIGIGRAWIVWRP
jgi:hypothetical protein